MRALNNLHLFTQTVIDSGSLTSLAMVIHGFPEPGEYSGQVFREKQVTASFHLTVDKSVQNTQVDIDLAVLDNADPANRVGGKQHPEDEPHFRLGVAGYALFHVSRGTGGYSVLVEHLSREKRSSVFNSETLQEKDLFSVTLIRP